MQNRPLLVGVTGGIGSGKSTVCRIIEVLGYKVYYADSRAKWLMNNDKKLKGEIISLFGKESYSKDKLNRQLIGELVFKDAVLLHALNARVHPVVGEDLKKWIKENNHESLLFDEAALMFEIGSYERMDATILVTAPEELRIRRVLSRDNHRSRESVRAIISQQLNDREKIPLADYIVENDETKSIITQTLRICNDLINHRK